jgi:hypothetical protein
MCMCVCMYVCMYVLFIVYKREDCDMDAK